MIIVNGKNTSRVINVNGTLSQIDGEWYVNGKKVKLSDLIAEQADENTYIINVQGTIERLEVQYCKEINITGNCKRVHTQCGDINIKGDVDGDVHTNCGAIECGNVGGDAHTNMGSIRYKK